MSNYASLFTGAAPTENTQTAERSANTGYRILLVDDEPNVLKALQHMFRQESYAVVTACGGQDVLELLKQVKVIKPEITCIMLTGHADTGAVMGDINEDAVYKFILKPWNDDDLRVTVALALEQYALIHKNKTLQQ